MYLSMEVSDFAYKFCLATLRTAKAAGMDVVPQETLVSVLAIIYFEDGNEQLTYSYKLLAEVVFAQEQFHFQGGEQPLFWIVKELQAKIAEIREYKKAHNGDGYPQWAKDLMKSRYGIELRG